jgi:hypothetical protein
MYPETETELNKTFLVKFYVNLVGDELVILAATLGVSSLKFL